MHHQNYKHVLTLLEEAGEIAILDILDDLPADERVKKMEEFFRLATTFRLNDSAAVNYFSFLMNCISDCELWDFISDFRGEPALCYPPEKEKEFHAALASAGRARATKTMELYQSIAGYDDLFETRKALLVEFARQWRETKDEQEAEYYFDFLIRVVESLDLPDLFQGKKDQQMGILREAVDKGFPAERLSRHFAQLMTINSREHGAVSRLKKFANLLVKAWARNCDLSKSSKALRAVQPLLERKEEYDFKTAPAFDLLNRAAEEIAGFDLAVQELFGAFGTWGSNSIPGKKFVYYPNAERAEISIEVTVSRGNYRFDDELLKKDGNKWFEMARDRAKEWRRKYPQYSLYLKLSVMGEFSPEPQFGRCEEIDLMP
jgi:hypothetical protein